jgi:hypothetical protein
MTWFLQTEKPIRNGTSTNQQSYDGHQFDPVLPGSEKQEERLETDAKSSNDTGGLHSGPKDEIIMTTTRQKTVRISKAK